MKREIKEMGNGGGEGGEIQKKKHIPTSLAPLIAVIAPHQRRGWRRSKPCWPARVGAEVGAGVGAGERAECAEETGAALSQVHV